MAQLSLDKVFLISLWLEALIYGFLFCLFLGSLYVNLTLRRSQDSHSRIMFYIGILMFFIATLHLSMNCYRLIEGYVVHALTPGGAVAYLGALAPWHHVFKDTLYATQEILGDAVAIYRTYVIWGRNWKPIALLLVLFIVSLISGYTVCGLYPSEITGSTVFDPRLLHWISTFYAVSFIQSCMTTGLMAFRIWQADRKSSKYRTNQGNLFPILRILVESASLQLLVEVILLGLYAANINAQYILLELVTPLVGVTFNAITIRIALRSHDVFDMKNTSSSRANNTEPVATIGSIPMRAIAINITKDVEAHNDRSSEHADDFSTHK